jgi:hypothetical protein
MFNLKRFKLPYANAKVSGKYAKPSHNFLISAPQKKRLFSSVISNNKVMTDTVEYTFNKRVAYWIFGLGGLVAGMVSVGGITRLTRSGIFFVIYITLCLRY